MKKMKLISMAFAMFIGLSAGTFAQEQQQDSGAVKGKPQTICPVMGEPNPYEKYSVNDIRNGMRSQDR